MPKLPKFESIQEEREFGDSHGAFEILDEDGCEIVEAGTTKVQSVYTTKIREKERHYISPTQKTATQKIIAHRNRTLTEVFFL
jgi:hypothetical protein